MKTRSAKLWELPFGKIYLVKGTLAQIMWGLRKNVNNVQYLFQPPHQTLIDLCFSCPFDDEKTVVVIPENYDIPAIKTVDPDARIFIVLVDPNGIISKDAEKIYKSRKQEPFIPVSIISRDIRNDTEIQMAWHHIEDNALKEQIYKKYKLFPHTLVDKLKSRQYKNEIDTEEKQIYKSKLLVDCLLRKDWYEVWGKIPKGELWPYFMMPGDPGRSFFYTSLTGLNTKSQHKGICPTLWSFIELSIRGSTTTKELRFRLIACALWVRSATTYLATAQKKGLYSYTLGSYTGYAFEPSTEAINVFFGMLHNF
jgi:hypothetical protein